jgi:lipoate-protein ligase A
MVISSASGASGAQQANANKQQTQVRIFRDPPCPGTWNMALDEALLHRAAGSGTATLRFYEWDEPTLSLGYFQRYAERASHGASGDCAVVRRATGGGAILHDRELTYSIVLPASHRLSRRAGDLYRAVHESIVAVLSELGVKARLASCQADKIVGTEAAASGCSAPVNRVPGEWAEPLLCFARRCPGDILVGDTKVAGSAQRRRRGAVLQHGSILIARSRFAPELPGINDIVGKRLDIVDVAARIGKDLADRAGFDFVFERPSAEVNAEAAEIESSKFALEHWTRLR